MHARHVCICYIWVMHICDIYLLCVHFCCCCTYLFRDNVRASIGSASGYDRKMHCLRGHRTIYAAHRLWYACANDLSVAHGADKDMCAVTYAAYTHTYSKPKKGEGQLLRESPRPRYFLSDRIWSRSSTRDNARGLRVFWEVFIFVLSRCVKTRWVRWWCGFLWACDQYCAYSAGAKTWRKHYIFFNVCCSFLFWIRSEIEIRELIWKENNVGCGFVYETIVGNH